DHVLGAANDEDVAARHVAHVASVEPIVDQARAGRFLVAEIAVHDASAADEHAADAAVGKDLARSAADLDLHSGDRLPAIDYRAVAAGAVLVAGLAARKLAFLDQLEADAFARRHQRHGEGRFGEAVTRAESAGVETGAVEAVDEGLHHVGADHVGAVAGDPPARQIEAVFGAGL